MAEIRYLKGKHKVAVVQKTKVGVRGDWRVVALEEFYYLNPYTNTDRIRVGMVFGCTPNLLWKEKKRC